MFDYGSQPPSLRSARTVGRLSGASSVQGVSYPSPFFDLAHTYLPPTVREMFRWCRYYYLTNPLINSVVNKMSEYPITDLVLDTDSKGLRDQWEGFFEEDLQLRPSLIDIGLFYMCLHRDTKVVTDKGVFRISDMIGETHNVLSKDGIYRKAEFRSYGRQRLLEVEFRDGSSVLATPEHEWPVLTSTGNITKVPTTELKGRSIPRTVAPRPEQDEDFYEGVRHGFVFGDGTSYKNEDNGKQSKAHFFGAKKCMVKYYEGHGCAPYTDERDCVIIHGLPEKYKELPAPNTTASYWYGFVCGFLAAYGSVDTYGCVVLTQKSRSTLEAVADQLPRFGMVCGPLRGHPMSPRSIDGREIRAEGDMHFLTLFKQFMLPSDLLLPHHRIRFEENYKHTTYGHNVTVRSVRETGIVDEVFCCTEEETHTFVIGNGILTGNCYGNAPISISFPFVKWLTCAHCGKKIEAKRAKYRFRSYKFFMTCKACGNTGDAEAEDVTVQTPRGTRLILWNPEDLDLQYNELTGKTVYYYTLPTHTRNAITMGKREIIEELPQLFIQSAKEGKSVVISPDNIFHLRRPSVLTGRHDRGWGIPLMLPVLKDTFYLQVMKKAQEAILVERIVPLTVIFPQASSGTSDPYTSINLTDWKNHINREIQKWRLDRNYIPILPLPIGNQVIGGDGRALLLSQEIRVWSEHIVAGMGVPQEFVFGGLQWSGSNVSLRMLENQFMRYLSSLLRLIKTFIIRKVAAHLEWPIIGARFKPFKMADDIQRKAYLAQLNQSGKVSDTTLLQDADLNPEEENELMRKETKNRMDAVKEQQMAEATIQGEVGLVSAKYQAKAMIAQQQEQMQAQQGTAGSAPGEPGDAVGSQPVPGGGMQPPAAGGGGQQGGGNPVDMMIERLRTVAPEAQNMILQRIAQQNPQLAQEVASRLKGVGGAAGGGSASAPLPTQLPPRRGPESAAI